MSAAHKKLRDQVIVITGAPSGIGLATAEAAAKKHAKLVLAARSEQTLGEIADRLRSEGTEVIAVACDVSIRRDVDELAAAAVAHFGRIDTWVNNAGLAIYGKLEEVSDEDSRRLFDVNFWGVVNGSLAAIPYLKQSKGTLINVGSEVSQAYVPLLGIYTASKHAVKGFTDTLRVELEDVEKTGVTVTLIQPTAVDTPFPQHARNYQSQEPKLPEPQIDPTDVADAILSAAVKPVRAKRVGFRAKLNTAIATMAPGIADSMVADLADKQHYDEPPRHPEGTLRQASERLGLAGQTNGSGGKKPR